MNILQLHQREERLLFTLKNNYLFLALMNKNEETLKMLICSVLGIEREEVTSLVIKNPMKIGESIDDKTFVLDVLVELNHESLINIELQIVDYGNWPDRPEFFSTYMMLNTKSYEPYTSKFALHVLDLKQIDKASDEDKKRKLDVWARIFQAKTWGDMMDIAEQNKEYSDTVDTIHSLTADNQVRLQCEARERMLNHEKGIQRKLRELQEMEQKLKNADEDLECINLQLKQSEEQLKQNEERLKQNEEQLKQKEEQLKQKDALILQLKAELENAKQ